MEKRIISKYKCTGYAIKFINQKGFGQGMGATNAQNREWSIHHVWCTIDIVLDDIVLDCNYRHSILSFLRVYTTVYSRNTIKISNTKSLKKSSITEPLTETIDVVEYLQPWLNTGPVWLVSGEQDR